MKRLFLIFTITMFLANTFVVAVWAKPCLGSTNASMVNTVIASSDDMPCHNKSQKENQSHCDGLCLCLHVSTNQMPIMGGADIKNIPTIKSAAWNFSNEAMTSSHPSPPYRPPNTIS